MSRPPNDEVAMCLVLIDAIGEIMSVPPATLAVIVAKARSELEKP